MPRTLFSSKPVESTITIRTLRGSLNDDIILISALSAEAPFFREHMFTIKEAEKILELLDKAIEKGEKQNLEYKDGQKGNAN